MSACCSVEMYSGYLTLPKDSETNFDNYMQTRQVQAAAPGA